MLDIARQLASRRVKENIDARRCIKSKYLNLECDLQQSKWFAYRFMSPWQATRKFALAYNDFYQRSFARHFDRNAKVQPVDWTEFGKPCRSMTHLWIGRQSADRLGMPYGAYLEFFDDFNMRRTRKHLPRPNQIEGSSEAQKLWPSKLAEFLMERAWNELARSCPMEWCSFGARRAFRTEPGMDQLAAGRLMSGSSLIVAIVSSVM
jgi:hypothetical protein